MIRTAGEASAYPQPRSRRRRSLFSWLVRLLLLASIVLPALILVLFRFVPVPATPLMMGLMLSGEPVSHTWMPLERISPNLVRAVIASEDAKFCLHDGFDWEAIDEAMAANASGARLRGASTISQQTAKNLFLPPDRTWLRKAVEAYLTVWLEALWPKRRILETYLNIAEWGPRRFGAEAAAEANFHKSAARLSAVEAARLAAILPNPNSYRADVPGPYVGRRSEILIRRMREVRRGGLDACVFQ